MTELGKKIKKLREEGKTYSAIQELVGCSKSVIAYYCSAGEKEKNVHRNTQLRRRYKEFLVVEKGGKCEQCGYNKCLRALEFHHLNPAEKEFSLSNNRVMSLEKLLCELEKCILICSNCHKELHDKEDR